MARDEQHGFMQSGSGACSERFSRVRLGGATPIVLSADCRAGDVESVDAVMCVLGDRRVPARWRPELAFGVLQCVD